VIFRDWEREQQMTESLREKYGAFFDKGQKMRFDAGCSHLPLRPERVPKELWPLLPYAAFWGISDDGYREELCEEAPPEIWKDFRETVSKYKNTLLEWETDTHPPTTEFVAFTAMLMAYDWPRA
jgi:hypothetical protein